MSQQQPSKSNNPYANAAAARQAQQQQQQQQRQQQQQPPPNAWQQPPPSLQQQQQPPPPPHYMTQAPPPPQQQQQQPPPPPPPPRMAYYTPYPNPYAPQHQHAQQQQQQHAQQQQRPASMWQPAPPPTYRGAGSGTGAGTAGGASTMYYPPPQAQQAAVTLPPQSSTTSAPQVKQAAAVAAAAAPPKRRALVITDKDGNVIDLSAASSTGKNSNKAKQTTSSSSSAATSATAASSAANTKTATTTTTATSKTEQQQQQQQQQSQPPAQTPAATTTTAGSKLRQAALERIAQMDGAAAAAAAKKEQPSDTTTTTTTAAAAKATSTATATAAKAATTTTAPSGMVEQPKAVAATTAPAAAPAAAGPKSYAEKLKQSQQQRTAAAATTSNTAAATAAPTTTTTATTTTSLEKATRDAAAAPVEQAEQTAKRQPEQWAAKAAQAVPTIQEEMERKQQTAAAQQETTKQQQQQQEKEAAQEQEQKEEEAEAEQKRQQQAAKLEAAASKQVSTAAAATTATTTTTAAATSTAPSSTLSPPSSAEEPQPKRPSFLQKLQAKKEAAGLGRGSSLSAMASKLDEQEKQETAATSSAPSTPSSLAQTNASSAARTGATTGSTTTTSSTGLRLASGIKPIVEQGGTKQDTLPSMTTAAATATTNGTSKRRVFTKQELLRFKEMDICCCRPMDLPDMTIERVPVGGGGGGGGGGAGGRGRRDSWQRGAAPPRDSQRRVSAAPYQQEQPKQQQQWARGVAPPPAPPPGQQQRGGAGGRGGRGGPPPLYDGPVAPLVKSENRWKPRKNVNDLVKAEKLVKAILNKMTKEKFDKLSTQMCEIPIKSYDMLTMMIHNVYEKAIDEPSFGDMYADLCAKLSQTAKQGTPFIKIIPSDEEPPTDGEATTGESSSYKVYRWSNDVSTTDTEIVGPYGTPEECTDAALSGEDLEPTERDEIELELHSLAISNGNFIKIMKKKDDDDVYYVVYFPVAEHQDCGQQLSKIFLSERECMSDAVKQNSFKRSLLNKCQDEFDKQDIYVDWKAEKKAYEETKSSLTEAEQGEKEAELDFRRMKIKKQMLGNIKFIGQLYKKGLLKEKIMRYCIGSLLKLEVIDNEAKNPEYKDSGDMDLDEEDHEAACSMFATIGRTIDRPGARSFMAVCFTKMEKLSNDQSLSSRSRFMYKDLIDLRSNNWEPRRATEKAKTIEEIRKDFEREERMQEQQSRQMGGYHGGGNRGGDRRGDYGGRRDDRRDSRRDYGGGNRHRHAKPPAQTDDDGFTVIGSRGGGGRPAATPVRIVTRPSTSKPATSPPAKAPKPPPPEPAKNEGPAPFSKEKLERRIDTIRSEYKEDPGNVEELMLSFDELSGTPDAGLTLVSRNADRIFDCKDAERAAIIDMLVLLVEKDKLSDDDVGNGLADVVEFIDSMVIDSPKAYEYLADVLSAMLKADALDAAWLCEQAEKLKEMEPDAVSHEKLVRNTMEAMKDKYGIDAIKKAFAGTDESLKFAGLLGAEKWNDMASEIMS